MATTRNLHTNVYINGINNLSGPIGKGVNSSINSLDKLSAQARSLSMLSAQTGRTFATMAAGMALPLVYAGKQALEFEDKMADVSKVTNVDVGSTGFEKMGQEVKDLSVYLGRSATETADLFTNLAQGGIAVSDLAQIGKIAGQVSVAFGISANAAGEAFSHIQNVMDLSIEKTGSVMDAINELSNTRNATAERILTFFTSGGSGVARSMDIQGKDIAAFGATLIAMGESGEEAGTIMRRFSKGINKSASLTKLFQGAGGGAEGLLAVLKKGLTSADPKEFFRNFGEYGNQIELLARTMTGPKGLVNALDTVKHEGAFADSVLKEFTNKNSTGMAKLRREWARFQAMMIDLGATILPILSDFLDYMNPIILDTTKWIKENKQLTTDLVKSTIGLIAFSTAMAGISFAMSGIFTLLSAGAKVIGFFSAGGVAVKGFQALLRYVTFSAFSMGLFTDASVAAAVALGTTAAAVAAIGVAFYGAYKYIEPFRHAMFGLLEGVKSLINHLPDFLSALKDLDFSRAMRISAAADLEAKINTEHRIFEDRAEHQPDRIKELRAGRREARGQEVNPTPSYMGPMPTLNRSMQTPSGTIHYSPTLNFNGPVGANAKTTVAEALVESQYEFDRKMKEAEKRKERRKL